MAGLVFGDVAGAIQRGLAKVADWFMSVGRWIWNALKKFVTWIRAGIRWISARLKDARRAITYSLRTLAYFIARVFRAAIDMVRSIAPKVFAELMKLLRWYFRILAEKPETGITATLLILYLLS